MTLEQSLSSLRRGLTDLVSEEELRAKLRRGSPLRVKLGVDPTSPDIHLGHTVVLNKLRCFQDMGHVAVLIIGDFTAQVGDPSGQDRTRPVLSWEDIQANAVTYQSQAFKFLDPSRTELRFNSEWLAPVFRLDRFIPRDSVLNRFLTDYSVFRLLEREEFSKRREAGGTVTLAEILYPLLQAYDSVAVRSDVELGGSDQIFNLLMGRQMQKDFGQEPQAVMTLPLLIGTDGVKKMSKSYGNAVALNDSPQEMFGKIMSVSDEQMMSYYELLTQTELDSVKGRHPKEAKLELGQILVTAFHGSEAAREARAAFEKVFSKKELPEEMTVFKISRPGMSWVDVLVESGMAPSRNEARRLLSQGGVKLDGRPVAQDGPVRIGGDSVLQVGKRQFRRVVAYGG